MLNVWFCAKEIIDDRPKIGLYVKKFYTYFCIVIHMVYIRDFLFICKVHKLL